MSHLKISLNKDGLHETLAEFAEACETLPSFGDAAFKLIDAGEELFLVEPDDTAAPVAGEFVVRFYPSECLIGLLAAFRTRQPECLVLKHFPLPACAADSSTTWESAL